MSPNVYLSNIKSSTPKTGHFRHSKLSPEEGLNETDRVVYLLHSQGLWF